MQENISLKLCNRSLPPEGGQKILLIVFEGFFSRPLAGVVNGYQALLFLFFTGKQATIFSVATQNQMNALLYPPIFFNLPRRDNHSYQPLLGGQIEMMPITVHKKIGVLFVQLGTPDAPTPLAVRTYLAQFLSDRRVVDISPFFWWPLLHGVILRTRPQSSATLYQRIWREDGYSPLLYYTQQQTKAVGHILDSENIQVGFAMRYGNPSLPPTLHAMIDSGIEKLLIFPLFPQYSGATCASILDAVQKAVARRRFIPTLRFAHPFFSHPGYIHTLAEQIRHHTVQDPTFTLFSFHGLPQRHINEGDPYAHHCHQTAHLLAQTLHLSQDRWQTTFQSRFGKEPWLEPSTEAALTQLPKKGFKHLRVVCPGFITDCLETLEEINIRGKAGFMAAGGKQFETIPCLNDSPPWTAVLAQIIRQELSGWL